MPNTSPAHINHDDRDHGHIERLIPAGQKTPKFLAHSAAGVLLATCTTRKEALAILMDKGDDLAPADPYEGRTAADVPGLRGKALQTYLDTGLRLAHQLKAAQLTNIANTKDSDMPATAAKPARKTTAKPAATGLTAATVARDNDLDPRKFRSFLRGQDIARTFETKAAATKAVKAFRKG